MELVDPIAVVAIGGKRQVPAAREARAQVDALQVTRVPSPESTSCAVRVPALWPWSVWPTGRTA